MTLGVKHSATLEESMKTLVHIMKEMSSRSHTRLLHMKDVYAVVSHVQDWAHFKESIDNLLRDGVVIQ